MKFWKKIFLIFLVCLTVFGSGKNILAPSIARANQISNYSFETDLSGWGNDSDFTRVNTDAYDGSWSVKQISTGNFANFTTTNDATGITVLANTFYVLTFYAKITISSGNSPLMDVNTGSAFGTTISSRDFSGTGGNWRMFELEFNPGASTKVWLRLHNNGGTVTAFYDNFNIYTPSAPVMPTKYIKSVDVMKYTKDNICTQTSTSTIDSQLDKIIALHANYVSLSGFYDDPGCAADTPYLIKWVNEIRSKGLKVWWRMKDLSFEGDYSVNKSFNPDGDRHINNMVNWLRTNSSLILSGDMFTPFAEIQNGGINGVTFCAGSVCQFNDTGDFNAYIRRLQVMVPTLVPAGVYVGFYGFDGFVAAGLGNVDSFGTSKLDATSISLMGIFAVDHYPEAISSTFAVDLPTIHSAIGASTPLMIGEYGTIFATSTSMQQTLLTSILNDVKADPKIVGFNYWNLGPVDDNTGEGLITTTNTNKPGFGILQTFFTDPASSTMINIMGIKNGRIYFTQ